MGFILHLDSSFGWFYIIYLKSGVREWMKKLGSDYGKGPTGLVE